MFLNHVISQNQPVSKKQSFDIKPRIFRDYLGIIRKALIPNPQL